jgi:hypothetical protein
MPCPAQVREDRRYSRQREPSGQHVHLPKIASWVWEAALQHAPHHPPSAPASGLTAAPGRRGRKECYGRGCLAAPVAPLHPSEPRLSATAMAGLLTLAHSSKRCEKRLGSACRSCCCACTGRTTPLAPPQRPRTLPGSGVSGCMTDSAGRQVGRPIRPSWPALCGERGGAAAACMHLAPPLFLLLAAGSHSV